MTILTVAAGCLVAGFIGYHLIAGFAFNAIVGYVGIDVVELMKIRESKDYRKLRSLILEGIGEKARLLNYRQLRLLERLEVACGEDLSSLKKLVEVAISQPQEAKGALLAPLIEVTFSERCEPALVADWKSLYKDQARLFFTVDYLLPLGLPKTRKDAPPQGVN